MRPSEMVLLANIVRSFLLFTSLAEKSILDAWNGSKYTSVLSSFKTIYDHLFLYLNHYLFICDFVNNKPLVNCSDFNDLMNKNMT